MTSFYFISLLLLFVLVLGMCVPNLSEQFTVSKFEDMDYYNWGGPQKHIRPSKDDSKDGSNSQFKRKRAKRIPYNRYPVNNYPNRGGEYKCYYEPSENENNYCQDAMKQCPLNKHPDINNYISKSMIPPQPNLNDYMLKSKIPSAKCPDPQKCPPHPDMNTYKKFMKKQHKCPTCPQFPKNNILDELSKTLKEKVKKHKKRNNKVKPSAGYEYV